MPRLARLPGDDEPTEPTEPTEEARPPTPTRKARRPSAPRATERSGKDQRVKVSFLIPGDLRRALKVVAADQGRDGCQVVADALRAYLPKFGVFKTLGVKGPLPLEAPPSPEGPAGEGRGEG